MSSVLLGAPPTPGDSQPAALSPPMAPPGRTIGSLDGAPPRSNTLSVIAGVGVLLLAMGVGVLIGRSGDAKSSSAPPQVISVASTPAAAPASAPAAAEATFTSDWPSGRSGYTVQLQTLAQTGTSVGSVEAAKSAAGAKGAKAVGALKSEEFSSLTAGSYVIYSGVYSKKPEAQKALAGLKGSFPGASVIHVSSGSGSSSAPASSGSSNVPGSSESHPAPPSVLKSLNSTKGKSYEEKSKNLPNVVETG